MKEQGVVHLPSWMDDSALRGSHSILFRFPSVLWYLFIHLGLVVRKPVNTNVGLKFNMVPVTLISKELSQQIPSDHYFERCSAKKILRNPHCSAIKWN